jgi:uncharacterized protein YegP (UPF0339 family)
MSKFVGYQDNVGDWRWRVVARNGKIIADSGESYTRREELIKAMRRLRSTLRSKNLRMVVAKIESPGGSPIEHSKEPIVARGFWATLFSGPERM